MARLRACPFCKKEVEQGFPYLHYHDVMGQWIYSHYCDHPEGKFHATIDVYGFTEQDVVDKWNGVYEDKTSESL